jgi:GDP-L-fucose synthase
MSANTAFSLTGKRVWVAGETGMVGQAIVRRLAGEGCTMLSAGHQELDLIRQDAVEAWMDANKPDLIFLAAARVGGIHANNSQPARFIYDNLMIAANIIEAARKAEVTKLVFLGSSCIYPKLAPQPIPEEALLTGALEPTNEWYAIAKIAGIKLCQSYRIQHGCDFISAMPTNLYGSADNFDLESSHVLPALLRKAHEAKLADAAKMTVWGSGTPLREFLHVDDLADALVFLAQHYSGGDIVNVGSGEEVTIRSLAEQIAAAVGFSGALDFDASKPDGTPRKLIDSSRLRAMGWSPQKPLQAGLTETYQWFLEHQADLRTRSMTA